MVRIFILMAVCVMYLIKAPAQNVVQSNIHTVCELKSASPKFKVLLDDLVKNCKDFSYKLNYVMISKKNGCHYKIIIYPIINLQAEQLASIIGILLIGSVRFYTVGDLPAGLLVDATRNGDVSQTWSSNDLALNDNSLFLDLQTKYLEYSLNVGITKYDIFIQPCR